MNNIIQNNNSNDIHAHRCHQLFVQVHSPTMLFTYCTPQKSAVNIRHKSISSTKRIKPNMNIGPKSLSSKND